MPETDRESRTEAATPRRREEAREKGQVPRSTDLSSALMLLLGLLFVRFYGPHLIAEMRWMFVETVGWMGLPGEAGREAYFYARVVAVGMARILLPVLLFMAVMGLAVNWVQFGFVFSGQPLVPNLDKLNPVNGMARLVSARGLAILGSSLLKVAAGSAVCGLRIKWELERILLLPEIGAAAILGSIGGMAFRVGLELGVVLLALSVFDYLFQRHQYERDLRMTPQEVKEELKRMEGDPAIRARRRAIMRRLVMQHMLQRVPEAEVVITNPTHLAVALKYDPEEMHSPEVVAKGQRLVAERIKALAREHGVPVVENRPLAKALFKAVEVGRHVPPELYEAVAEVLALVWGLNERRRAGAA